MHIASRMKKTLSAVRLAKNIDRRRGIIVIVLAAVLLELLSVMQYRYTRGLLEKELEKNALTDLIVAGLRIEGILSKAEVAVENHLWDGQRHLDNPEHLEMLLYNLVKDGSDNIIGAFVAMRPYYYEGKGKFYESYARQWGDSVSLAQIGSEQHDYTHKIFFRKAMNGDTAKWTSPYVDNDGAQDVVITYALPLCESDGKAVGVMGVDLSTEWIGEVVNREHHYASSFSFVVDDEGNIVAGPLDNIMNAELTKVLVTQMNDSMIKKEIRANGRVNSFAFTDEATGESGHIYYAHMKHVRQWIVAVVCYDKVVFGMVDKMRRTVVWIGLIGLLVLGVIIQLFVRGDRRLKASQLEQERIGSELRIAEEIQKEMLPKEGSIGRNDVSVACSLVPAREVGGDLYDFFLRDEKLFFCIGDVSGKGVPAAMLMAVIHTLFRSASAHENNPARMMQSINESACQGNESNMFVTLFIGVLDLPTGRLRYCNAGHDRPMIIEGASIAGEDACAPKGGTIVDFCKKANIPVGAFDDMKYNVYEYMLTAGSTLFLYTDGLTEARNGDKSFFGIDRVRDVASRNAHRLIPSMTEAVKSFVAGVTQSDDITMLVIHYTPTNKEDVIIDTLTLKNDAREVRMLSEFLKGVAAKLGLEPKTAHDVRLAVEECVVNVMEYAYPPETEGTVTIEARLETNLLKYIIIDNGAAFDPTKAANVDTSLSAEERPIGGLGIHLVRKLMDSINYERVERRNTLMLIKRIND